MQNDTKYNGWTNRETWVAAMWMTDIADRVNSLFSLSIEQAYLTTYNDRGKIHRAGKFMQETLERMLWADIDYENMSDIQREFCSIGNVDYADLMNTFASDYIAENEDNEYMAKHEWFTWFAEAHKAYKF